MAGVMAHAPAPPPRRRHRREVRDLNRPGSRGFDVNDALRYFNYSFVAAALLQQFYAVKRIWKTTLRR